MAYLRFRLSSQTTSSTSTYFDGDLDTSRNSSSSAEEHSHELTPSSSSQRPGLRSQQPKTPNYTWPFPQPSPLTSERPSTLVKSLTSELSRHKKALQLAQESLNALQPQNRALQERLLDRKDFESKIEEFKQQQEEIIQKIDSLHHLLENTHQPKEQLIPPQSKDFPELTHSYAHILKASTAKHSVHYHYSESAIIIKRNQRSTKLQDIRNLLHIATQEDSFDILCETSRNKDLLILKTKSNEETKKSS